MIRSVLILSLLTVLVGSLLLYFIFKLLATVKPSKKKIQEDLKKMKEELTPLTADLVPIGKEELELFSQKQVNQAQKKRVNTNYKGVYTTIYNEPVVAYIFKQYGNKGKDALLYARSANHEFAYRISKGEIKIVIDNKLVGTLKNNRTLYSVPKNTMIARYSESKNELLPIFIKDKEVGNVVKGLPAAGKGAIDQRAFEFLKEDLDEEEKQLFLSLAILELVTRKIE